MPPAQEAHRGDAAISTAVSSDAVGSGTPPTKRRARAWQLAAALYSSALAIRLVHLHAQSGSPLFAADLPPWDSYYYTRAAWGLASGQGWTPELAYVSSPPYLLFLSGCFALFGRDVWLARVLQALLAALTPVLLYRIGARVFDRRAGIAAGILAALYGPFVFYDGELLKPWAGVLVSCATLDALLRGAPRIARGWLFGAGVLLALLVQLRGNLVSFVPIALLWTFWAAREEAGRRAWVAVAWLCAGFALVQLPYLARDRVFPEDRPAFSEGVGLHFYLGNHEGASGTYSAVDGIRPTAEGHVVDAARIASSREQRALRPAEVSRYWLGLGLDWVRAHPGEFFRLVLRKLALAFNAYEVPSNEDLYLSRRFSWVLQLPLVGFGLVCPLAILGLALRMPRLSRGEGLVLGYLVCAVLSLIALFVTAQYRLAMVPALLVFAAQPLVWLWDRLRERQWGALASALVALAGVAAAVDFPQLLPRDAYAQKAEAQLRAALGELPDSGSSGPGTASQRALLEARGLTRAGKTAAARQVLELAMAASPDDPALRRAIGDLTEGAPPASTPPVAAARVAPSDTLVLVVIDTLRADHVSCYGYAWPTAPSFCALAAAGARFERAYTPRTETTPAIASLFTGLPPHRHGVEHLYQVLPAGAATLAEQLHDAGYATGAFVSSFAMVRDFSGFAQGFDVYDDTLTRSEPMRESFERGAAQTVDAALAWLRRAPPRAFLFVHLIEPHGPYTPGEAVHRRFARPPAGPVVRTAPAYQVIPGLNRLSEYVSRYDAEIATADAELGRLIGALGELGREARSTVVVTADHGESFGEDGQWLAHGSSVADAEAHVPLVVRFAGAGPRGNFAMPVSLQDLHATLLGAAGLAEQPEVATWSSDLRVLAGGTERSGLPPATWLPRDDGSRAVLALHANACTPRWEFALQSGAASSRTNPGCAAGDLEGAAQRWIAERAGFQRPFAVTWRKDAFNSGFRTEFLEKRGDAVVPLSQAEKRKLRSLGYMD